MAATKLLEEQALVRSNEQLGPRLFLAVLESPRIAAALQPGQFVHMQVPGMPDRILRRPFSVYKTDQDKGTLEILYQVVGSGTEVLCRVQPGEQSSLIGPVGNTWDPPADVPCLLVAGGVGAAPLFMLAQQRGATACGVQVVLGAQSKDSLVTYEDYRTLSGVDVLAATDDGSFGYAGFCTVPAQEAIATGSYGFVAVCGPEPVMRIVAQAAAKAGLPCQVSLERRMACGVGACLSCTVETTEGKKRCCVDGPVFSAEKVIWA